MRRRALENYFSLSDYTDFKKNDYRDFWTFSEISGEREN